MLAKGHWGGFGGKGMEDWFGGECLPGWEGGGWMDDLPKNDFAQRLTDDPQGCIIVLMT
ncbi:hypothetical protein HMPREF0262_03588 [Clostridium sp. ATCC 29733]|nr:hypothetical protein HMPREF0262_03588 [Clostridium sp. ATCC 29733]